MMMRLQYFYLGMIKQQWESQQSPKIHKKQYRRFVRTPQQQIQLPESPYNELLSANPILPPGVHKDYHENQMLKHKYIISKQKLNRTSFPQVKSRNWLNQTHRELSLNKLSNNHNSQNVQHISSNQIDNIQALNIIQEQQLCQFKQVLLHKMFVYSRINNRVCNRIQKYQQSYFCSIFINSKKQQIKSKKIPIFEYLPRIFKYMHPWNCQEDLLTFNSAFQSGNLFCVTKSQLDAFPTYQLYMNNDINTKGCTQWFYFSIRSQRRIKIKIKVMNFYKTTSLYMNGMKILVSTDLIQWKRIGTAIKYNRVGLGQGKQSYYLQFIYEIQQQQKEYYFSYGYPYTYSQLENVLGNMLQTPIYSRIINKSILCQTYLGNSVYMLTISNNLKSKENVKPYIYVIARQHPGETPASYIAEGLIKALLHNRLEMEQLRDNFIIKVIPMVNVDGVVNGNYRSNFSGNDVNRQWQQPSRKLHPEVYYLKQQIFANKKSTQFFLDIHAHSRKMNSFFYGSKGISIENRLYPFICSKLNKNISYSQSTFIDDPSKKTTARVILQNDANIKKSLTFEASFYGYEDQKKKIRNHFKQQDLRNLGESLALGLYYSEIGSLKYSNKNTNETQKTKKEEIENGRTSVSCHLGSQNKKEKIKQVSMKIEKNCERIMDKWRRQIQKYKNKDKDKDKDKDKEDDVISEGSSIDPEHFQLSNLEQDNLLNIKQLQERYIVLKGKKQKNNSQKQKGFKGKVLMESKNDTIMQQNKEEEAEQQKKKQKKSNNEKMEDQQKQKQKNQLNTKLSFFPMQSNLRNSVIVKKLQSQLQMNKTQRRYSSIGNKKQSEESDKKITKLQNEIVRGKRFKSIDVQVRQSNSYRNNIIEIKKALKYFMENKSYEYKSTDYDDYKNYLKYSTNGNTLVLSDKDSVARIKRKYART